MKATILLVEDDRLVLYTLARGLRDAGYHVLEADSAEVAMQICAETCPDLALLDMRLPDMSGIEFARWLKATLAVPFLFLSAYSDTETVNVAAEMGALGYLVKPLDVPQVLPAIPTALQRAKEIKQLIQSELDLSMALKTSRKVSMAVGILMQRCGLGADQTFNALRAYSRSNRIRLVDLADQVVLQGLEINLHSYLPE